MTEFLIYQAKAAVALAVFYMFYRLLLSRETFHRFNRIVLLGTAMLSFVLPLCVITVTKTVTVSAVPYAGTAAAGAALAGNGAVTPEWWQTALAVLFAGGAFAMLVSVIASVVRIRKIIGSGEQHRLESGEIVVITDMNTQPFSWMKYIVLSREDSGNEEIITHEKAHIEMGHSWDLLIADMITAMQWFNPAIWMLRADLRALHEFEADDAVLKSGADIKKYQYLLIRKAVGKSGYSVANSFNHSTLKQRITMMLNKKSTKMSALKALYIIPLAGISLAAGAKTVVEYRYDSPVPDEPVKVTVADTLKGKDTQKKVLKDTLHGVFTIRGNEHNIVYIVDGKQVCDIKSLDASRIKNISVYKNGTLEGFDLGTDGKDGVIVISTKDGDELPSGIMVMSADNKAAATKEKSDGAEHTVSGIIVTGAGTKVKVNGNTDGGEQEPAVYIVDGKRVHDIRSVDSASVISVEIRKDPETLKKYGAENKKAVIFVTTRQE